LRPPLRELQVRVGRAQFADGELPQIKLAALAAGDVHAGHAGEERVILAALRVVLREGGGGTEQAQRHGAGQQSHGLVSSWLWSDALQNTGRRCRPGMIIG